MIPTGVELLALDAALLGFLSFQQVQRQPAQCRQILRREAGARPALVIAKTNVQHPVQFVFHAPVTAHRPRERLHAQRQTRQKIPPLHRPLATRVSAKYSKKSLCSGTRSVYYSAAKLSFSEVTWKRRNKRSRWQATEANPLQFPRCPLLLPQPLECRREVLACCRNPGGRRRDLAMAAANSWLLPKIPGSLPRKPGFIPQIAAAIPRFPGCSRKLLRRSRRFLAPPTKSCAVAAHSQASAAKLFAHKPQTKTTKSQNYE
jgi:hypothetical protein